MTMTSGHATKRRRVGGSAGAIADALSTALSFPGYTKVWNAEYERVTYTIDETGEFGYDEATVKQFVADDANEELRQLRSTEDISDMWDAEWDDDYEEVRFCNAETGETVGSIDEIERTCPHCEWEGPPDELADHAECADEAQGCDCYSIYCHVCQDEAGVTIGELREHGRCRSCASKNKGVPRDYGEWVDIGLSGVIDTSDGENLAYWSVATFYNGGMRRKAQYSGAWSDFSAWCQEYVDWMDEDADAESESESESESEM